MESAQGLTSSILAGNTYKAFEMAPKVLAGIVNMNSPTVNDEIHATWEEFATVAGAAPDRAEQHESECAQPIDDSGCDIRLVELRQPGTEESAALGRHS